MSAEDTRERVAREIFQAMIGQDGATSPLWALPLERWLFAADAVLAIVREGELVLYGYLAVIEEGFPHWITHTTRAGIDGMRASDEKHYPGARLGATVALYAHPTEENAR